MHEAAEKVSHGRRHVVRLRLPVEEHILVAIAVPQAHVHVRAAAGPRVMGLRHEGHRVSVLPGDLLHAVLEQRMPVGALEWIRMMDVYLVLSRRSLALARLDGYA